MVNRVSAWAWLVAVARRLAQDELLVGAEVMRLVEQPAEVRPDAG